MSVVINTNNAASVASNNLATSSANLQRSLNRLSSGSKIVNPSDDAGGLAVSMKLSAAAKRSSAAANNIGNAISLLQTQDGVLKVTGKILDRMSELATLYADQTKDTNDTAAYSAEFDQLTTQLGNLATEEFNGTTLMTAALDVYTTEAADGGSSISIAATTFDSSGASDRWRPNSEVDEVAWLGSDELDRLSYAPDREAVAKRMAGRGRTV